MQDAILFVLMVSISGAILMPAFTSDIIMKSQIEREKNEIADETLLVLLATTVDNFSYCLAEDIIKSLFEKQEVNILDSKDFGEAILDWIAGRTQNHKSYGELLAECLACQLLIPADGKKIQANLLTKTFTDKLRENISRQLNLILGTEYQFNFSARWYPIIGIPFGGEMYIGPPPPKNAYVAKTWITMPFSPKVKIGNDVIILAPNQLRKRIEESSYYVNTIGRVKECLDNMPHSDESWKKLENSLVENITGLVNGFLFLGLEDEEGNIIFEGVVNIVLHMIFDELEKIIEKLTEKTTEKLEKTVGAPAVSYTHLTLPTKA